MQKRLIAVLTMCFVCFSLVGCRGSKKAKTVEEPKPEQVYSYLKGTQGIVEVQQELVAIIPNISALNDSFSFGNISIADVDNMDQFLNEERKKVQKAEDLANKGLQELGGVKAGEVCGSLEGKYKDYFNAVLEYCRTYEETVDYFLSLNRARKFYAEAQEELNSFTPPKNSEALNETLRTLQKIQSKLASLEEQLKSCKCPEGCPSYNSIFMAVQKDLYSEANGKIRGIKKHQIIRPEEAIEDYKKRMKDGDSKLIQTGRNFDDFSRLLVENLNNLADEVNNEIYQLDYDHPSKDSEGEDWKEFSLIL